MTEPSDTAPGLRPLRASDAPAVLAAFLSDPGMSRQADVSTAEAARAYVGHLCHPMGPHRAFAIVMGDELVGLVAVTVEMANRTGWFWYWMHANHRRHGWTSRAAATIANWALDAAGVERLELKHRAHNPASAHVAIAAGFVHEGTEREKFREAQGRVDVLTYGRLRTDPRPVTQLLSTRKL